jgi:hypothetical protein
MSTKSYLAPILALLACGLPAGASTVEYCSGSNPSCSTFSQSAFNNAVITDVYTYTYGSLETFSAANGTLSGTMYTDAATGIEFIDYASGSPSGALSDTGGTLSSPVGDYTIQIVIPQTYLAITLMVNVSRGLCGDYCAEGETVGFVGFIDNDSPTSPWIVNISQLAGGTLTEITGFNAAGPASMSDTPEVGTMLLIGFGLISMRWLKRVPWRLSHRHHPQTA